MRPVDQTISGIQGNCLQAVIASLLDLPLEDVPPFQLYSVHGQPPGERPEDWFEVYTLFLQKHGCCWHGLVPIERLPEFASSHGIGGFFIGGGPSPRGAWEHAVIIDSGGAIIHDPHPGRAGLLSLQDFEILGRKSTCRWGEETPQTPSDSFLLADFSH